MIHAALLQVIAQSGIRAPLPVEVFNAVAYSTVSTTYGIINNINLADNGGFIWERYRGVSDFHSFIDSARGIDKLILPTSNGAEGTDASYVTSFLTTGYAIGDGQPAGRTVISHTWRRARRFLDIVTYTGTGATRTVAHNLGVAPGMIWIKKRNATANWRVYHRSLGSGDRLELNSTAATAATTAWNSTDPTASAFSLGTDTEVNANGDTYVAYIFAHDPAGIIQCGTYTGNGSSSGPTVTLGWQPQYLMIKRMNSTSDWNVIDAARGFTTGNDPRVTYNTTAVEASAAVADASGTGFQINSTDAAFNANTGTYAYMAVKKAA